VKLRYGYAVAPGLEDGLANWIYTHESYVHPKLVLEDDDIAIMGMDESFIWFSITPSHVKQTFNDLICNNDCKGKHLRHRDVSLHVHRSTFAGGKICHHANLGI